MNESKLTVLVIAPEETKETFCVTLSSDNECHRCEKRIRTNEKAVFFVPEGDYMLCVGGGPSLSPGRQRKWIHAKAGCCACFSAVFRTGPKQTAAEVTFTVRDAVYPNIIPMNGGITIMAASDYTIRFTNGVSEKMFLPVGTYSVKSIQIPGYENAATDTFTITRDTQYIQILLRADGVLRVLVKDDQDTPITDGTLQLSNGSGSTTFGSEMNIVNGVAVFRNVPYNEYPAIQTWIKQNGSDADHDPIAAPQAVALKENPQTVTIRNLRKQAEVGFTAVDPIYTGMVELTGSIVVTG